MRLHILEEPAEAIAVTADGVHLSELSGFVAGQVVTRATLGVIYAGLGAAERGIELVDQALGIVSSAAQFHRASILAALASVAALRIRNISLAEEAARRQALEREMTIARQIQLALLPESLPDVPGYSLFATNDASRSVSGDFYEVQTRPETNEPVLVIADVSGKGIGASLLTAYVDALVNAYLGENLEPAEIFNRVSPQMNAKTPVESFATAFLGIFSIDTGELRYASAGHDPTLLIRSRADIELLMPTGMPLGLMPEAVYTSAATSLEVGDSLVLYTDGITEAANPEREEFGRDRLVEACRKHRDQAPIGLASAIEKTVDTFVEGVPFHDDRTLVIVRRV